MFAALISSNRGATAGGVVCSDDGMLSYNSSINVWRMNMQVTVNGDPRTVPEPISVEQLVQLLELKKERIAVELNRNIIPRGQWEAVALKSGDDLEIVHFVGGG